MDFVTLLYEEVKIMKKIFYLLLLGVVSYSAMNVSAMEGNSSSSFLNYNGIVISEIYYLKLENLGFTENEIMHMTQDQFDDNKDLDGEVVSEVTIYVKVINGKEQIVSEEEYDAPDMSLFGMQAGYIETGNKTVLIAMCNEYKEFVNGDYIWVSFKPGNQKNVGSDAAAIPTDVSGFRYKLRTKLPSPWTQVKINGLWIIDK